MEVTRKLCDERILYLLTEGIAIYPDNNLLINPGGGRGALNEFLYGEAFLTKTGTTLVYLLSTKGIPFHIPCLELCIPFNCCTYSVF